MTVGLWLAAQAPDSGAAPPSFKGESQELLYYWGTTFGQQLAAAGIRDRKDIEWIIRGLQDQAQGKAPQFGEEYKSLLNNHLVLRRNAAAEAEAGAAVQYLEKMAAQPGAVTLDGGIVYREIAAGTGPQPAPDSMVVVHYVGTLRDGRVFDSSRERGSPLRTPLSAVIACWSQAIPMMKQGGRAIIGCPPGLAYGERGTARIPGGSALSFDVELLEVSQ